jgi:hypothetical protein
VPDQGEIPADGYIVHPDSGTVLNRKTSGDNPGTGSNAGPGSNAAGTSTDPAGSGSNPGGTAVDPGSRSFRAPCGGSNRGRCFALDVETGAVFPDFHDWLVAYLRGDPSAIRLAPHVLDQKQVIIAEAPLETRQDLDVVFKGMETVPGDRIMEPEALPRTATFDQSVNDLRNFAPERQEFGGF